MLKFGIIGAGMISQTGFDGLTASGGAEVVALADQSEIRARAYAKKNGIAQVYSDAQDLIQNKSIDGVYIALPNRLHVPMAEAALRSGKHVILEKPFALNLAEAQRIQEAVKVSGKHFMLGMNQRFAEGPQKIKALADQNYFGDIYAISAYWRRRSGIPKLGTWFGNKAQSGGGCLLDIGVHMLDLALFTVNNFEVETVSGSVYSKIGRQGYGQGNWGWSDDEGLAFDVDDLAFALLRLKGGATVQLGISWAAHQKENDYYNVELHGTEAGAKLYPGEVYRYDAKARATLDSANLKPALAWPHCDRFVNFVRSITGDEKPGVSLEQALKVQGILDALYLSAQQGREIRM
jgi:predicted dehydrogenase